MRPQHFSFIRDTSPSYAVLAATWWVPMQEINPNKHTGPNAAYLNPFTLGCVCVCSCHVSTKLFLYFKYIFLNPNTILINVNPKVVCFDCCGGVHLDLCSNTVSLGSILYSLVLKDYGLTEQRGKHVNNLVGLHSACSP